MKLFKRSFIVVGLFLALVSACKENAKKEVKTENISFTKEGELSIFRGDSLIHSLDIEMAESDYETQTGLMYRESMEETQGMLFLFANPRLHSFYMKNTEFPLDILYIDQNKKLVTIKENAQPFDESGISSEVPVQYVLEINAGLTQKWGLQLGDSIAYSRN
ncbi:DUF192 domain-containing protein [Allomuricauda sp. d1]|uniref:DUF192 domain-containing protein n=1 Tax=Allomuricauda sp. d1 TaxID=3136725 RepID=UPI0031E060EE